MMKRLTAAALALCLMLGLTACGSKSGDNGTDGAFTADLTAFYDEMFNTVYPDPDNAPAASEVTGDYLEQLYPGLDDVETTQCLVYAPMITAVAYEVALVEVADSAMYRQYRISSRRGSTVRSRAALFTRPLRRPGRTARRSLCAATVWPCL